MNIFEDFVKIVTVESFVFVGSIIPFNVCLIHCMFVIMFTGMGFFSIRLVRIINVNSLDFKSTCNWFVIGVIVYIMDRHTCCDMFEVIFMHKYMVNCGVMCVLPLVLVGESEITFKLRPDRNNVSTT